MTIEELLNNNYIIKTTPNLSVKDYMIIKNCGLFEYIFTIANTDVFIINKLTKRKIKINKLLNNNNKLLNTINNILKQNSNILEFIDVTDDNELNNFFYEY